MGNWKTNIVKFLKGEYLLNEDAFKNWRMLVFIIILLLFMVRSGHITDEKVDRITKLSKEERELRAEYIALRSKTMKLKLESNVYKRVASLGLLPSKEPAIILKEIKKK